MTKPLPEPQGGLGPGSGQGAPATASSNDDAVSAPRGRYHVIRTERGAFIAKIDTQTGVLHYKHRGESGEVDLRSLLDPDP